MLFQRPGFGSDCKDQKEAEKKGQKEAKLARKTSLVKNFRNGVFSSKRNKNLEFEK